MSMKKTLTIAAMAAVMMLGAVTAPTTAFAAAAATGPETEVTIAGPSTPAPKPEEQNISISVPTKLTLALTSDGKLASSANFNIINNSAFDIHVKDIHVAPQSPFNLVDANAFDTSPAENVFTFTLGKTGTEFDAATSFVPATAAFNLGTSGQPDATLTLIAQGRAKNVKADLSNAPASAAKLTWTFAPGAAK